MIEFRLRVCMLVVGVSIVLISPLRAQDAFVRGGTVIFADDLSGERVGEFPSRWRLLKGGAEVVTADGGNVISFRTPGTDIAPLMRDASYLPPSFTIEFDYLMNHFTQQAWELHFVDGNGRGTGTLRITGRNFQLRARAGQQSDGSTPDTSASFTPGWRRLALSYNQGEMRVYGDDTRLLNLPGFDIEMRGIQIRGGRPASARPNPDAFIRNIVIAEGGMPLYERVMTDGKFVTNEIQFDVNRAEIRPESAAVIGQVAQLMQAHPELRFSVEGHTDSDGDADWNQRLSQQRAESVVQALIGEGIAADRLTAKGWGAAHPVAGNDTADGKARNRRVEFVKM